MVSTSNAYEVNIWDERPEQRYGTGAIVDIAAVDPMPKAGGRWMLREKRRQAKTPAVSCMRADTSPRWWKLSPKLISSCVSLRK